MKKFLGRLFLCGLMALALSKAVLAQSPVTARLDFDDGTCSGTVVAPTVILSAGHCFQEEENDFGFSIARTSMKVDGYEVKILAVVLDGNDHALVKVDFTFHSFAKLAKVPAVGAHVHYWGNPAGINNVYREGYVTSYHHSDMILNVNGFFGDSGAGIFNEDGNVVGVVSFIAATARHGLVFSLMGANALEFTPLQYDMMGVAAP
jgi:V8-like Glu-specific endopeptidase